MCIKRLMSILLIVFMTLCLATTSFANTYIPVTQIVLKIGQPLMLVNGDIVYNPNGAAPVIKNGTTLLPIAGISDILGGRTEWSSSDRKVTISLDGNTVELWIDSKNARVNGESVTLQTPPTIINGKTMVPLRFVSENLGMEVIWHGGHSQVITLHSIKDQVWFNGNHVKKINDTYSTFNEGYAMYHINYLNEWGIPSVIIGYHDEISNHDLNYYVRYYSGDYLTIDGLLLEGDYVYDPYTNIVDLTGIEVGEQWSTVSLYETDIPSSDAAFLHSEIMRGNGDGEYLERYTLFVYNGHKITILQAEHYYNENEVTNRQQLNKEKKYLEFFLENMLNSIYYDAHAGAAG